MVNESDVICNEKKCHGCIYYDPCWMTCRLKRDPKDCSFGCKQIYKDMKLTLSSVYGKQVRE